MAVLHETSLVLLFGEWTEGRRGVTEDMGPAAQTDPVYARQVAGWGQ